MVVLGLSGYSNIAVSFKRRKKNEKNYCPLPLGGVARPSSLSYEPGYISQALFLMH